MPIVKLKSPIVSPNLKTKRGSNTDIFGGLAAHVSLSHGGGRCAANRRYTRLADICSELFSPKTGAQKRAHPEG
jgi:hypothetical protein